MQVVNHKGWVPRDQLIMHTMVDRMEPQTNWVRPRIFARSHTFLQ